MLEGPRGADPLKLVQELGDLRNLRNFILSKLGEV